ncbi:Glutamyl-tRNA(Gln) amidotransferase subunit F, mitochondrial [Sphaceloma murrayae]|uniref:Glutamyl-tRNA(Gln) amidotransferase subunit F, mitochondrial n=1 Tax=Sphaceloma murrayae TaxID=2082308 RepID=A0A2K1QQF7_9PEZI|nr:Glutamyl-tRNA(Gln) amidotransferase subunit F, mitochondrial [Sphaceloma murrayae]
MSSIPLPLRPSKYRQASLVKTDGPNSDSQDIKGSPSSQTSSRGRSSVKRFGSLASLDRFNPFTRRDPSKSASRPDGNTQGEEVNAMISTEDELTPAEALQPLTGFHLTSASPITSETPTETGQKKTTKASRRGSWIPIPEQSSRPLPRSLTLGNLQLPLRASKAETRPDESRRQGRFLPSESKSSGDIRTVQSRIPSAPKAITKSALPSSLPRSDTEPLLPRGRTESTAPTRRAARKENILPTSRAQSGFKIFRERMSDKPLPPCPDRRSISTTRSPTDDKLRLKQAKAQKIQALTDPPKPRLIDIPRRALPRFHTQPNLAPTGLTSSGSRAVKTRTEIKQHSLLSPRAPPTPVQRSPLSTVTNLNRSASRPPTGCRKDVDVGSPDETLEVDSPVSCGSAHSRFYDPSRVVNAEPIPYWSGRFISSLDHWRTADFERRCSSPSSAYLSSHPYSTCEQDERRMQYRVILAELYADCEGEEAKASLQVFHAYLRTMHVKTSVGEDEGVAARVPWGEVSVMGEQAKIRRSKAAERMVDDGDGLSRMRKGRFMERLLGRTGRRAAV